MKADIAAWIDRYTDATAEAWQVQVAQLVMAGHRDLHISRRRSGHAAAFRVVEQIERARDADPVRRAVREFLDVELGRPAAVQRR